MTYLDSYGNITHSYGDLFALTIRLSKPLDEGEMLVFAFKNINNQTIKSVELENNADVLYSVIVDTEDMAEFKIGRYCYDVSVKQADGNIQTLTKLKGLNIVEVAHNV